MNFLAPFKTLNFENARERSVQCSRPKAQRHAVVALGALLFALSAQDLTAQVGNNNPSGASGIFNGQVNTGCSYDPYTGNATRSITDIAVAGAVGEYPLALVRTANSRTPSTSEVFGFAGGWNHNYNWILEDSEHSQTQNFHPASYTVEFPDGRVETFTQVNWDTSCYRVRASNGGAGSSAGVRERFVQLDLNQNNQTYLYAYLVLPDGGKIEFKAVRYTNANHNRWWYKYHATAIYDPYGLRTQLVSSTTPSGVWRRLDWVIEPAGRWLHFVYTGTNSPRIASVTASDGRAVQYYYSNTMLDHVSYYSNPNWTASYQYTGSNIGQDLPPLLWTCDDPMYPGPMRRIAYQYKTGNNADGSAAVYGQIFRERYWDGVSQPGTGAIVSELTVGASPNNHNVRTEKRADNANQTRTFTYSAAGYLTWVTDFMGHSANQDYDDKKYVNSVTNFNRITTDYTNDPITGNVTQIQFPLTVNDTPGQNQRPTVNYTYTNNYYLHTSQNEGGHTTTITRDGNNRVSRIDCPDGGYETFSYDPAHFYQISTHHMLTGGTESWTYNARHRKDTYRNPDNTSGNPTARYLYDNYDRVSDITDVLGTSAGDGGHTTSSTYNLRGQLTVTTLPNDNGSRHTVRNYYNDDGTVRSRENELYQSTQYTYDEYRRLKSVTPQVRGWGDNDTNTTYFYYGVYASDSPGDYKYTDSSVTWLVLPSVKNTKTIYDDNRRKQSMIVAPGSAAEATTSYGYDNVGNVTTVTNPRNRSTTTIYDERNRPSEIHDPYNNITRFTYDTAGRRKTITRPNGQVITNASFDEMNRVLQQNVTQTPGPLAVTKYTYYPSGLLNTMTDPRNSTDSYIYVYDLMGRKLNLTYPADSNGNHFVERFTYDTAGRLETFKNRVGKTQTFRYDGLNRMTQFLWDDSGTTPTVNFGYDVASRLTSINNINANITRAYYNDNLLRQETESIAGGSSKTVAYTYNADGKRANVTYPDYQAFAYTYTGRNQLRTVGPWSTYSYDENGYTGDLTTCALNNNTHTTYNYDPLDRVTWITHWLTSGVRGFNYGYDDVSVGNRKYLRRTGTTLGDKGDVFSYDLADQAIGVGLNVTTPQSTPSPARTIFYDANGNRTTFRPYGPNDTYVTNNLNQYTSRNSNNATYNANGDITITPEPAGSRSIYGYDAQNRVLSASKSGGGSMSFTYDGLNRQVSRTAGGVTTYNVWDGWDLIEEYGSGGTATAKYVYGATGLVKELVNNRYYYEDGSGSTSHIANSSGVLQEWYRYDLQGAPFFYNASDTQLSASGLGVRHLFTGQQWYQQLGLYDLRNRFYSPDLGRFLQSDPIDFDGDSTNLYRYCGNNPLTRSDPSGLWQVTIVAAFEFGLKVTFGYNSGQFNLGSYGGVGYGFALDIAPGDSGVHDSGIYHGYTTQYVASAEPFAPAEVNVSSTGGMDPSTDITGTFANFTGGIHIDQYGDSSPTLGASYFGAFFAGVGTQVFYHQKQQNYPPPGGSTYVDPNGCPDCDGEVDRVVVTATFLESMNNRYWGYLPTTNTTNFAGGRAMPGGFHSPSGGPNFGFNGPTGGPIANSIFGPGNFYSGLDPISAFPNINNFNPIGAMEPGIGPGSCFAAGTPILMADGAEKPIEDIKVGETVLAWNEETKKVFPSKVVSALHHEERPETLFDIELEDGRKFTVNNAHPVYVIEDGDFKFSDDLATRFAKGETVTFQDSEERPVKIASLRMRKQICKMYNLHVEGQGKNGHTYFANGILVHNSGAGNRLK